MEDYRIKRKAISLLLAVGLLFVSVPGQMVRAEKISTEADQDKQSKQMEKAVLAVRSKIEVPKELLENFEYYYRSANDPSGAGWMFYWSNDTSMLMIACDSNYHITGYRYRADRAETVLPVYLKSELKLTADSFLKKVLPETVSSLKFIDSEFDDFRNGSYIFTYERVEHGIPMPDNQVKISVDAITGNVIELNSNFTYNLNIPKKSAKLSEKEAAKQLKQASPMQLVYRNYYKQEEQTGEYQVTAKLVYVPKEAYCAVDAMTGKVYTEREIWGDIILNGESKPDSGNNQSAESGGSGEVILSEAEQKRIEELGGYLTEKEAIAKVRKNPALYLEDTLNDIRAVLKRSKDYRGNDKYIWKITMADSRPVKEGKDDDNYRAYASATVQADNGALLSFSSNIRNYDENTKKKSKLTLSKKEGKKLAEQLIQSNLNPLFKNTRLFSEEEGAYILTKGSKKTVYGGYEYRYVRVNEGVDYNDHYIFVSVDAVSGKVLRLDYSWDNTVVFESPKDIITPQEAFRFYLDTEQYQLIYEVNSTTVTKEKSSSNRAAVSNTRKPEVRLVYRNMLTPAAISPYTGKQVALNGTEMESLKDYTYSDIDGLVQKRQILLLADFGIGFDGGKFLPEQAITAGEWKALSGSLLSGKEKDEISDTKTLTREQMAEILIQEMRLEEVAALEGIYKTGFEDESQISPERLGAVALVKGFGFLTAKEGNKYLPKAQVTRLEAVELLIKFLSTQKQ